MHGIPRGCGATICIHDSACIGLMVRQQAVETANLDTLVLAVNCSSTKVEPIQYTIAQMHRNYSSIVFSDLGVTGVNQEQPPS